MLLTMYKVGFGDCFKLEDTVVQIKVNNDSSNEHDNSIVHRLLVDCGSKNADLPVWGKFDGFVRFIYNDLFCSTNIEQIKRYALLTHFHEDHYKGFMEISDKLKSNENKFDKFYIPYITWSSKEGYIFVKAAIYLYYFGSKQNESSFLLFDHMKMLINSVRNISNICCLQRGNEFELGNIRFQVLWPDFPKGTHTEKIEDLLTKIDNKIEYQEKLNSLTDKFLSNLRNFYELIKDKNREDDKSNLIKKILESQQEYLFDLDRLRKTTKKQNKNLKLEINDLRNIFKDDVNATSIVFCDNNKQLLMMGDVTAEVVDKHLFTDKYEYIKSKDIIFEYLKAPHHGTGTHYTINIPATKNILISTGKFGSYGKISDDYYEHRLSEGNKICTSGNDWCNVIDKGKRCKNDSMCEISDNHKDNVIKIDL